MKILIIEDEYALSNTIDQYLEKEGFLCEVASTFSEALMKSRIYEYDCILIDITLPGGSGLDILKDLKKEHANAGVIIISAKHSLEDKVKGLEMGSDDYLGKPFHLSELNARIKALIRRKNFNGEQWITFEEIKVNLHLKEVYVKDQTLNLTRSEYRLLLYFMSNSKRVLSKESIAEHLAGENADLLNSLDFIYSHIKNLRKKLVKAGASDYIRAVYGMGYKFSIS